MKVHRVQRGMGVWVWGVVICGFVACGSSDLQQASDAGGLDAASTVSATDGAGADAGAADTAIEPVDAGTTQDAGADSGAPKDPSAPFYDAKQLLDISIEMPPEQWDLVRLEDRDLNTLLKPVCGSQPFAHSFTYRKAKITINGETLSDVGIRKKGFIGSISDIKPSLKLKFDKFVEDQRFHGIERMTLNNNRQDRAFVRQCLAYGVFRAAGIPAPRCNFARVHINGADFGIFTHVENVKKRFLARHFVEDGGHLYEGTLSDFRVGWMATFEPKTNTQAEDLGLIAALQTALELPDDKLLPALDKIVDMAQFYTFWAVEGLVNHADGYAGNANNFFIYADPTSQRLHFMPWGVDSVFHDGNFLGEKGPAGLLARAALVRRLYLHPEGRAKFLKRMTEVLVSVWDKDGLQQQITQMTALIGKVAAKDPLTTTAKYTFVNHVDYVRNWINVRESQVQLMLEKPPEWKYPLPAPFCNEIASKLTGSFSTTFGTSLVADAFNSGTSALSGHLDEHALKALAGGAKAGYNKDDPTRVEVTVALQHPTAKGVYVAVTMLMEKDEFVAGQAIKLKGILNGGLGIISTYDPVTKKTKVVAGLWSGTLTLTKADTTAEASVSGTFTSQWIPLAL